jgi:hypothetical protein
MVTNTYKYILFSSTNPLGLPMAAFSFSAMFRAHCMVLHRFFFVMCDVLWLSHRGMVG